jgi:hypothetical protein
MHMNKLIALAALLLPVAALAGGGMQPGSYEFTTTMEIPGMSFTMPPITLQRCLTKEDIEKNEQYPAANGQSEDCEARNLKQTGARTTFDLACKNGMTGKAEYTVTDTGMTGKTVLTREGQPMTMNMGAKRLGDCK